MVPFERFRFLLAHNTPKAPRIGDPRNLVMRHEVSSTRTGRSRRRAL